MTQTSLQAPRTTPEGWSYIPRHSMDSCCDQRPRALHQAETSPTAWTRSHSGDRVGGGPRMLDNSVQTGNGCNYLEMTRMHVLPPAEEEDG